MQYVISKSKNKIWLSCTLRSVFKENITGTVSRWLILQISNMGQHYAANDCNICKFLPVNFQSPSFADINSCVSYQCPQTPSAYYHVINKRTPTRGTNKINNIYGHLWTLYNCHKSNHVWPIISPYRNQLIHFHCNARRRKNGSLFFSP